MNNKKEELMKKKEDVQYSIDYIANQEKKGIKHPRAGHSIKLEWELKEIERELDKLHNNQVDKIREGK